MSEVTESWIAMLENVVILVSTPFSGAIDWCHDFAEKQRRVTHRTEEGIGANRRRFHPSALLRYGMGGASILLLAEVPTCRDHRI